MTSSVCNMCVDMSMHSISVCMLCFLSVSVSLSYAQEDENWWALIVSRLPWSESHGGYSYDEYHFR